MSSAVKQSPGGCECGCISDCPGGCFPCQPKPSDLGYTLNGVPGLSPMFYNLRLNGCDAWNNQNNTVIMMFDDVTGHWQIRVFTGGVTQRYDITGPSPVAPFTCNPFKISFMTPGGEFKI
mgnify:CR=1 FL=1